MQRNLSPTASLQVYVNRLEASVKEKTPHQEVGEALNSTFCASSRRAGGRTAPHNDLFRLYFALSRNIVAFYKNIIAIIAIVVPQSKIGIGRRLIRYKGEKYYTAHSQESL